MMARTNGSAGLLGLVLLHALCLTCLSTAPAHAATVTIARVTILGVQYSGSFAGARTGSFSGVINSTFTGNSFCPPNNVTAPTSGRVALTERGSCDTDSLVNAALDGGYVGIIIIGNSSAITSTVYTLGAVVVSSSVGTAIRNQLSAAHGLGITATVDAVTTDEEASLPIYTRTAMFVVLCILIIFVVSIYCHSSMRANAIHQLPFAAQPPVDTVALRRMTEERIHTLPIKPYGLPADGILETCAVCLDEFSVGLPVRVLSCRHSFHVACIDPWLLEHRTCPLCKANILEGALHDNDREHEAFEVPDGYVMVDFVGAYPASNTFPGNNNNGSGNNSDNNDGNDDARRRQPQRETEVDVALAAAAAAAAAGTATSNQTADNSNSNNNSNSGGGDSAGSNSETLPGMAE